MTQQHKPPWIGGSLSHQLSEYFSCNWRKLEHFNWCSGKTKGHCDWQWPFPFSCARFEVEPWNRLYVVLVAALTWISKQTQRAVLIFLTQRAVLIFVASVLDPICLAARLNYKGFWRNIYSTIRWFLIRSALNWFLEWLSSLFVLKK